MIPKPSGYVMQHCSEQLAIYEDQRVEMQEKHRNAFYVRYAKSWLTRLNLRSSEPSESLVFGQVDRSMRKDPYFAYLVGRVQTLSRLNWMAEQAPEVYITYEEMEILR